MAYGPSVSLCDNWNYQTGTPLACEHLSNWRMDDVNSLNSTRGRLSLVVTVTNGIATLSLYKANIFSGSQKVGYGAGSEGIIIIAEENGSGISGWVEWDGGTLDENGEVTEPESYLYLVNSEELNDITTTTTTTLPPEQDALEKVETIVVTQNGETVATDGSDNRGTQNTIDADSLSVGPLAPGETSATKIIYLKVPNAVAINNIRIGLISDGGIPLTNTTFGVETKSNLDYTLVPSEYFGGVNTDDSAKNVNNKSIGNKTVNASEYVYLNISLPLNHGIGGGTVKFKWYFDYA